jgi:hypothetical protein
MVYHDQGVLILIMQGWLNSHKTIKIIHHIRIPNIKKGVDQLI